MRTASDRFSRARVEVRDIRGKPHSKPSQLRHIGSTAHHSTHCRQNQSSFSICLSSSGRFSTGARRGSRQVERKHTCTHTHTHTPNPASCATSGPLHITQLTVVNTRAAFRFAHHLYLLLRAHALSGHSPELSSSLLIWLFVRAPQHAVLIRET